MGARQSDDSHETRGNANGGSQAPRSHSQPSTPTIGSRPSSSQDSNSRRVLTQSHPHYPHLSHPHRSHHSQTHSRSHRVINDYSFMPSVSSRSHVHTDSTRSRGQPEPERDRRAYRYGNPRPHFIELDFTMPSLDQRLVARPRSVTGTHDTRPRMERRPRTAGPLSSSAPANSILFVRGLTRVRCPLCAKDVVSIELEEHLVICMTKPRVSYNVDKLTQDAGECSICLDDMLSGDEIARLPCFCVYHVKCLQQWYKVNQTCPEHPESTYT